MSTTRQLWTSHISGMPFQGRDWNPPARGERKQEINVEMFDNLQSKWHDPFQGRLVTLNQKIFTLFYSFITLPINLLSTLFFPRHAWRWHREKFRKTEAKTAGKTSRRRPRNSSSRNFTCLWEGETHQSKEFPTSASNKVNMAQCFCPIWLKCTTYHYFGKCHLILPIFSNSRFKKKKSLLFLQFHNDKCEHIFFFFFLFCWCHCRWILFPSFLFFCFYQLTCIWCISPSQSWEATSR